VLKPPAGETLGAKPLDRHAARRRRRADGSVYCADIGIVVSPKASDRATARDTSGASPSTRRKPQPPDEMDRPGVLDGIGIWSSAADRPYRGQTSVRSFTDQSPGAYSSVRAPA
jgi:hypothetical protein